MDVDGTLYRRNRVDLRVAERSAQAQRSDMPQLECSSPDQARVTGEMASAETQIVSGQGETGGEEHLRPPRTPRAPVPAVRLGGSGTAGHGVYSRSGRLSRPP